MYKQTMETSAAYILPGTLICNYTEKQLIEDVCEYFCIKVDKMYKFDRKLDTVQCRQICAYMLKKKFPDITWHKIGNYIKRDHATAMHCVKVVETDLLNRREYRATYDELDEIIEGKINRLH